MKDKPVILVVDDQPQNIELLEALLVPQGYEVVKLIPRSHNARPCRYSKKNILCDSPAIDVDDF